jgi:hypothetical protein
MMVKAPDFLHGLQQDEYKDILQDMLSDIDDATRNMYVLWEDELLDDIHPRPMSLE